MHFHMNFYFLSYLLLFSHKVFYQYCRGRAGSGRRNSDNLCAILSKIAIFHLPPFLLAKPISTKISAFTNLMVENTCVNF